MAQEAGVYQWVTVGGVPVNAETARGAHYDLAWERRGDYQYHWEVTDMMRPVASGVARNRPQARAQAERAARAAGDTPSTGQDDGLAPLCIYRGEGPPTITATIRTDGCRDPFILQIGDRPLLAMSGATLRNLVDAAGALVDEGALRELL